MSPIRKVARSIAAGLQRIFTRRRNNNRQSARARTSVVVNNPILVAQRKREEARTRNARRRLFKGLYKRTNNSGNSPRKAFSPQMIHSA